MFSVPEEKLVKNVIEKCKCQVVWDVQNASYILDPQYQQWSMQINNTVYCWA
jgi:hypothetical protein